MAKKKPKDPDSVLPARPPGSAQFKPGQSGNPGGRKKIPDDLKQAFRELSWGAIDVLTEVLYDTEQPGSVRVQAAEVILNRGWGKPTQPLEGGAVEALAKLAESLTEAAKG